MPLSKNEIKLIRSLQQRKFRDEESLFVVEGVKMVEELLNSKREQIQQVYHTDIWAHDSVEAELCTSVTSAELERISGLKSANQVLAVVRKFEETQPNFSTEGLTLVLDSINDPGNLGTMMRTADWFGISQIICSTNSVDLYNPKVVQASMGAIFRTKMISTDLAAVLSEFKSEGIPIYGAEMSGSDAFKEGMAANGVLLMGSESHGISENLNGLYQAITIPKFGSSESLNVGMAAGILMAEWAKQHK